MSTGRSRVTGGAGRGLCRVCQSTGMLFNNARMDSGSDTSIIVHTVAHLGAFVCIWSQIMALILPGQRREYLRLEFVLFLAASTEIIKTYMISCMTHRKPRDPKHGYINQPIT